MATYYHGNSEIHGGGGGGGGGGDGLQTLILMNPAYVGYSDAQQPQQPTNSNFVFLNPTSTAGTIHHAPPSHTQHFVGVPLQGTNSASAASPQTTQQQDVSVHGFHPPIPYNLYNLPMDNEAAARDVTRAQQGLSLSLSSQPPPGYGSFRQEGEVRSRQMASPQPQPPPHRGEDVRVSGGSPSSATASGVSNGVTGVQSVILSSKYLKAAQELLDEVVNVGKVAKTDAKSTKGANNEQPNCNKDSAAAAAASGDVQSGGDSSAKRAAELTTAERQEIQMKKAKLVNMLEEVEHRYRQYHQQMQIVISWFEQAAGIGSAKTYTALALETISKQFRCLKDAIIGQIRGVSKSLGEEESLEGRVEGSRLKYVDNQIRQQRALQQLGMIQHNAWRPQRGLPERSVSVLRAWLFEHFLHPYPKDSDKIMLAKQTGLTRSQVSNWFINARVRLWKPMVEEMYTEEMKEHDKNGGADDKTTKTDSKSTAPPPLKISGAEEQPNKSFAAHNHHTMPSTPSPSPTAATMRNMAGFNLISEMESINQSNSPKKMRILDSKPLEAENDAVSMKFGDERESRDGFTLMGAPTNFIGGFGSYPMAELGRFGAEQFQPPYSGNGVSLTLGLPHCENISISGAHQSFMPNQSMQLGRGVEIGEANDFGGISAAAAAANNGGNVYENLSIQNRKRFAAQLLPDFVA